METQVKLIFTVAVVVVSIAFCFVNPKANNAGPDWFWPFGKHNSIRNLICRPDGSFRRYTKLGTLLWFAVFLAIIWILVPTK